MWIDLDYHENTTSIGHVCTVSSFHPPLFIYFAKSYILYFFGFIAVNSERRVHNTTKTWSGKTLDRLASWRGFAVIRKIEQKKTTMELSFREMESHDK